MSHIFGPEYTCMMDIKKTFYTSVLPSRLSTINGRTILSHPVRVPPHQRANSCATTSWLNFSTSQPICSLLFFFLVDYSHYYYSCYYFSFFLIFFFMGNSFRRLPDHFLYPHRNITRCLSECETRYTKKYTFSFQFHVFFFRIMLNSSCTPAKRVLRFSNNRMRRLKFGELSTGKCENSAIFLQTFFNYSRKNRERKNIK